MLLYTYEDYPMKVRNYADLKIIPANFGKSKMSVVPLQEEGGMLKKKRENFDFMTIRKVK